MKKSELESVLHNALERMQQRLDTVKARLTMIPGERVDGQMLSEVETMFAYIKADAGNAEGAVCEIRRVQ